MRLTYSIFPVLLGVSQAVDLDMNDPESIKDATKQIAAGVMDYYDGNHEGGTIGVMSPPYYWWESASAFNGIFNYGLVTKDDQYEDTLYQSLLAQTGDNWDFITANQSNVEGNDDQGYWAIFALEAAERNFRAPPDGKTWVSLAENVFNQMVTRWDPKCGGGLRWQIWDHNHGFNYKNSVSTGCMFNIAARLAHFTNNQTYVDWSYKIYNWMVDIELITPPTKKTVYHIFDGAGTEDNCTEKSTAEWSYNYGMFLSGMSYLHDLLETDIWADRIHMNWERASAIFFKNDDTHAMLEPSCQPQGKCNNDQRSFRAPFSRFLAHMMIFMPEYKDDIEKLLIANANNAAKSCSGGSDGVTCGQDWSKGSWDGVYGLGEEMAALEVIISTQFAALGKPMTKPEVDNKPSEPAQYLPPKSTSKASSTQASTTQAASSSVSSTQASSTEVSSSAVSSTETHTSTNSTSADSSTIASTTSATSTNSTSGDASTSASTSTNSTTSGDNAITTSDSSSDGNSESATATESSSSDNSESSSDLQATTTAAPQSSAAQNTQQQTSSSSSNQAVAVAYGLPVSLAAMIIAIVF